MSIEPALRQAWPTQARPRPTVFFGAGSIVRETLSGELLGAGKGPA